MFRKLEVQIENALRSDTGVYKILLKNSSGETEASAMVTVVSKPTPPKGKTLKSLVTNYRAGPLDVSNVCADGALLKWEAPEDDGGEPLEEYIIEAQEAGSSGKFKEVGRVTAGQTEMQVAGLKNKTDYKFRVKAKNKEGESDPLATDQYTTIKDPWDEPGKPGRPMVKLLPLF